MSSWSSIPYNPQPPTDPLQSYGRMVQLKGLLGEQQFQQQMRPGQVEAQQQQLQRGQYEMDQLKAVNEAYKSAIQVDANGQPIFDEGALTQHLSQAGHGSAVPEIMKNMASYQKTRAEAAEATNKVAITSKDMLGYAGRAIQLANYDPGLADSILEHSLQDPTLSPQGKQQVMQMRQAIQNPATLKQMADGFVSASPAQQTEANARATATIRAAGHPAEGETKLTQPELDQQNAIILDRRQKTDPNATLGPYELKPGATQKDVERVEKMLTGTENAVATSVQRDTANAARAQMIQLQKDGLDLRKNAPAQAAEVRKQNALDALGKTWQWDKDAGAFVDKSGNQLSLNDRLDQEQNIENSWEYELAGAGVKVPHQDVRSAWHGIGGEAQAGQAQPGQAQATPGAPAASPAPAQAMPAPAANAPPRAPTRQSAPQKGMTRTYQGQTYQFDGQQWVLSQ